MVPFDELQLGANSDFFDQADASETESMGERGMGVILRSEWKFAQTASAGVIWVAKTGMFSGHQTGHQGGKLLRFERMVPKKGLDRPSFRQLF